jgi:hypothetical protein
VETECVTVLAVEEAFESGDEGGAEGGVADVG